MKPQGAINWRTAASVALLLLGLSAISVRPARAQSQSEQPSDVQQLQMKVEQMEKQMQEQRDQTQKQMQELKQQISAMEHAQVPPTDLTPDLTIGGEPSHVVTDQPPKRAPTPEHGTAVDLYGFVMLDSGYDFATNNPDWFDVVRPTKLNAFPGEFAPDGKVWFGVRQTRFGIKTSTPTPLGDLKTHFEFELFGTGVDAGQTTFRLRHAYGELGAFGAGQTWSPFMDIDVFPNSLEYWGPNGMVFYRNVQVRWMPQGGQDESHDRGRATWGLSRPGQIQRFHSIAGRQARIHHAGHFRECPISKRLGIRADGGHLPQDQLGSDAAIPVQSERHRLRVGCEREFQRQAGIQGCRKVRSCLRTRDRELHE